MATTTLTPRQQEIQGLLDNGKTPKDIAKKLKITENAVYQQLRRIRAGGAGKPKASKSRSGGSRTGTKRPASKTNSRSRSRAAAKPAAPAAPSAPAPVRHDTPLQSIRHRRGEIMDGLKATKDELESARKAHEQAEQAHKAAEAKFAEELKQLDIAEKVLKGEALKAVSNRKRPSGNGAKAETPTEAAPAAVAPAAEPVPEPASAPEPEPVATNGSAPETEADVAHAAAEAPGDEALVGEERPGVPTVPEFAQDDPFEG